MDKEKQRSNIGSELNNSPSSEQVIGGRYKVLTKIGAGGMGELFKVRHLVTGRVLAVKVLKSIEDGSERLRFKQEARAACAFSHPNSVSITDYDIDANGHPFLVMEFIEGDNLSTILHERKFLPEKEALPIFIQILSAIEAAHAHGVIHRDLKPSNVIVQCDAAATVKVVDFGIAKMTTPASGEAEKLTRTGEVFGSPSYMSPEQYTGGRLDYRSDIYSVGCLMYEVLTGKVPYRGDSVMHTRYLKLNEDAPPMSSVQSQAKISPAMEAIVSRCLEREPSRRLQTAADVVKALQTKDSPGADFSASKLAETKLIPSALRDSRIQPAQSNPQMLTAKAVATLLIAAAALLIGAFAAYLAYDENVADFAQSIIDKSSTKYDGLGWNQFINEGARVTDLPLPPREKRHRLKQMLRVALKNESDDAMRALIYKEFAKFLAFSGDSAGGKELVESAKRLYTASGNKRGLASAVAAEGEIYEGCGEPAMAGARYQQAIDMTATEPSSLEHINELYCLGRVQVDSNQLDAANNTFAQLHRLCKPFTTDLNISTLDGYSYKYEAIVAEKQHEYVKALELAKKGMPTFERFPGRNNEVRIGMIELIDQLQREARTTAK